MSRIACWFVFVLCGCHHSQQIPTTPLSRAAYAHYLAGKAALYGGDPGVAASELSAAALAAPDQPMIVVEQSRALVKSKQEAVARDVLAKARGRWPEHAQVWLASGEILEKSAPPEAIRAYRRAIEIEGDNERAYLGLARTLAAHDDARGAEATLRSLVSRVPASVEGHYRLAQRLVVKGDLATSALELRAVLEHDPDHIDARLDLARVLRRLGKLDEAIGQTRSAFDRAGQPLDIAEELFWLLCEADDRTAAIDLLTLLDDDRSDAEALATVARLDIGLGRIAEATAIAAKIAAQDADAATVVTLAIDLATHDAASAARHAIAVGDHSPAFTDARRLAAEAAIYAGDAKAAIDLLEPARRAKPNDIDLALTAARALADLHRIEDATAALASCKRVIHRSSTAGGGCDSSAATPVGRFARSTTRPGTHRPSPRSCCTSRPSGGPTGRSPRRPKSSTVRRPYGPRPTSCAGSPPCVRPSRRAGDTILG